MVVMTVVPERLLAIDIETASPGASPGGGDFQDTEFFELVAVGLGFQSGPGASVESTVLFREGGWGVEATADLLRRVVAWCGERDADAVLTHNGERFDEVHLSGWAAQAVDGGVWPGAVDRVDALFESHVDTNALAVAAYADRLESWQSAVSLEDACDWEGIPVPETWYADYDLDALVASSSIEEPRVTNVHVGEVLGEAYVDHVVAERTETPTFHELERLLVDYTAADVAPLFALARSFDAEA